VHARPILRLFAAALALPTLLSVAPARAAYPEKPVQFIAQSKPGSGFDTVTRAVANTLAVEKLVNVPMPVTNMPSSAVALTTIVKRHKGDPYMLSFQSIAGHMNYATGSSPFSYKDVTPIARLASDYYGVFVRKDSPMKTLEDFLAPLRKNPKAFPIVGGRSDDRVFYGLLFEKTGIDPVSINYIAYGGGGESTAALMEGTARAMITTIGEVVGALNGGEIRLLAFSGGKRLAGGLAGVPTLREAGVDLEFQNFRYAMGGPDMPAHAVKYWQETLAKMVKTKTWQETLARYNWSDEFLITGFDKYLAQTQDQVTGALQRLGMAKKKP
jgi:putative tricarboxylic transport membrane protein